MAKKITDTNFITKLVGRAHILDDSAVVSTQKLQAVQKRYLEDRGAFPNSVVSQPDTLALQAVILTTGRPGNLNDDVMLNSEVLPVLWTAALKPFNIEHTKFIVGCMFDAFAVNKETGEVVPGLESFTESNGDEDDKEFDTSGMPENLDIITNQVLWSLHFPAEVANIKRQAIAGELFVSMEVWFQSFDYLVGNRIVKRTPELAQYMDSKLRINGGTGFFGIDRVKRIPRKLTFAGNAAVETPANPESFILNVMDRSDVVDSEVMVDEREENDFEAKVEARIQKLVAQNTLGILESLSDKDNVGDGQSKALEVGRSDNHLGSDATDSKLTSTEVDEVVTRSEEIKMFDEVKFVAIVEANAVLKHDMDKVTAALAEVNKDKDELQARNAELEAKLEDTLSLLKEKEEALAAKAEAFEELEAEQTQLNEKLEATSAELAEIAEQRKLETRKAALAELKLSNDRIAKILAKTNELDDEAFACEVADLQALMAELTPVTPVVDTEEVETVETVATSEVEVEATEDEIAEVLDEATEEQVPVAEAIGSVSLETEDDEVGQIRSAFAKALGINL